MLGELVECLVALWVELECRFEERYCHRLVLLGLIRLGKENALFTLDKVRFASKYLLLVSDLRVKALVEMTVELGEE